MAKDTNNGANLGFESELWRAADAHRSNMDAAEYKHVVLGLIFLKRDNHSLKCVLPKEHADTYHAWRCDKDCKVKYEDVPGFCKSATLDDIRKHVHVLTPGRYVGAAPQEEDDEPFEEKIKRLVAQLREQTEKSRKLDEIIWANLEDIGYGR